MHKYNSQKYIKYFYRKFKAKQISEPYTSLKFILFKTICFFNKINYSNINKQITYNHNRLKSFAFFNKKIKKQIILLNEQQKLNFIKDCLKRLKHIPIQYILKQWYFRNKIFHVDYNVLIPRIETEQIIEIAFNQLELFVYKRLNNKDDFCENQTLELNFLEIGIGSGCIFITILKEYRKYFLNFFSKQKKKAVNDISLKCIGIDINDKCCQVSRTNSILIDLPYKEYEIQNISFEEFIEKNQNLNFLTEKICEINSSQENKIESEKYFLI